MKKFFSALVLFFLLFSYAFIFTAPVVLAKCNCTCTPPVATITNPQDSEATCSIACKAVNSTAVATCIQIVENNAGAGSGQVVLTDPLNLGGDLNKFWGRLIGALLAFVGVASLITFVYAGFMFLTSTGNQEQVKKAKDTMIYAVIGAAVSMGSYAILSYIFNILQSSTGQR